MGQMKILFQEEIAYYVNFISDYRYRSTSAHGEKLPR